MRQNEFPPGWDEERVQSVIDYYENQMEDESASQSEFSLLMEVFTELESDV